MIRATEADRAEIEAFLMPRAEFAMFPLNNLARHGMAGGHPYAVVVWLARAQGAVTDVLAQTEAGMVMPCLPSGDYTAAARALRGRAVSGFVGPKADVRGVEAALTLRGVIKTLDHDEPHFLLSLDTMVMPDGPGQIVPLTAAPPATIKAWMLDYQLAALNTPADQAEQRVADSYAQSTAQGSQVVLMDGDIPLAMTGFNARLPAIVQIGGVYTPPALRGRGLARRALALHLAQVQATGVQKATLFSASAMAARAYRALGFREIGAWSLILLAEKAVAHG